MIWSPEIMPNPVCSVPKATYAPTLTSTTGYTFGNGSANITISGGVYSPGSTGGWYPMVYSTPLVSNNFFVQCTLNGTPSTTAAQTTTYQRTCGVVIKSVIGFTQQVWCGVDSSGCYILTATSGSGGTVTLRASTATAWASADVMKVTAIGSVYTIYRNGASHVSWTDSTPVITDDGAHRYGGLYVSQNNFTASTSVKLLSMGDFTYETPVSNYSTMVRASTR